MMGNKFIGHACDIITGKLDSNHAVPNGAYPFYTCAASPDRIDTYAYDNDVVLVAGNNAQGNFHVNRFKGKFNAYQRTYILAANEGYDIDFIYYALKLELKRLKEKSQGSQTKFLTMPILKGIRLQDLDFTQQQKIAAVLSVLDAKIECNKRINTELEAMTKILYNYWFVQFDFPFDFAQDKPDKNGKPYKSSGGKMVYNPILKREIPAGWEVKKLNTVTSVIRRGLSPKYVENRGIVVLNQRCIREQKILFSDIRRHKNILEDDDERLLRQFDVVVNSTGVGTLGRVAFVKRLNEKKTTVDSHVTIVRADSEQICDSFLAWSMLRFQPILEAAANGSTGQVELSKTFLEELDIIIPDPKVQQQFSEFSNPLVQKMATKEKEVEELTQLRDWLLPMLMNGQVKVE